MPAFPRASTLRRLVAGFLLFLPLIVFHRALFLGEAFVPADLLSHLWPWHVETPPHPWNVLRFDGITQFYPWRLEAARQIASGQYPFWNPYQFAANGGTPLAANSQSAPLYPPNLLFALFYKLGAFWYAFGLFAALHLWLMAKGMYRLLRAVGLQRGACVLGATSFTLSGPVICWLALPTFLSVATWLPWLLLCVHVAHQKAGTRAGRLHLICAALCIGLMLLAGHLQIAAYCLLAAGLYLLWQGHVAVRMEHKAKALPWLVSVVTVVLLGITLSLAQLLPVLTLSHVSSRGIASPTPTMEAYNAFTASAFPARSLVTLIAPNFFGHPNGDTLYWNSNNYTEWTAYLGIAPLLLALVALALPWRRQTALPAERGFWALLAAVALLLAMGTWLNLPLFFLVPGYHQFGNPGRVLVVFTFAVSGLAAFGLQGLQSATFDAAVRRRAVAIATGVAVFVAAIGLSAAATYAGSAVPVPFGNLLALALPGLGVGAILIAVTVVVLLTMVSAPKEKQTGAVVALVLLTLLDLAVWGYGYNPTSRPDAVYPVTPGIQWLQQNAANALIAPINQGWSMTAQSPRNAVLPPNELTVYGLHDLQGYDSLFPAVAKEQVNAAGGTDASPPENGNIVFIKQVETAAQLGARFIVVPPGVDLSATGFPPVYTGADLAIYENPNGHDYAPVPTTDSRIAPYITGFRNGAIGSLFALLVLACGTVWALRSRVSQTRP